MKVKEYISKLGKDELLRGSIILFVMIAVFNLLNYIFQMIMARALGPAEYSILAVLMSFLYIFGIPTEAIQTIIVKYTSIYNSKKENGMVKDLLLRSLKKLFYLSCILFIAYIPFAILFSILLKMNLALTLFTGLLIFYCLFIPLFRGILQGQKKFISLGVNLVIDSAFKLIAGVILIFFGLKIWGAISAFIIGGIFAIFFAFGTLRTILKSERKKVEYPRIYLDNLPVLLAITAIVCMYTFDILLARRFFSPELAGAYSFVSLIAKTILFSSFAIGKAMFPLTSENFQNKIVAKKIFKKAFIFTAFFAFFALILFAIVPKIIIRILALGDNRYLIAHNVLFVLGLAFSFASLSYILILYNLSLNKMKKYSFGLLLFVFLEFVLLGFFHQSLFLFSFVLMLTNFLMLLYILWCYKK